MLKATIHYHGDAAPVPVVVGTSEDVTAPRGLVALEKAGWPKDDNTTIAYKVWLAAKRQGDVAPDSKFEAWIETVADIDVKLTKRQIEQMVLTGKIERQQGDDLLALMEQDPGE